MNDPRALNLWFLAPGIAHLLGNALFTAQGRARLLATGVEEGTSTTAQVAEDARAVLDGTGRAFLGLSVLRGLLGEGKTTAVPCGSALHDLADIARVPLRDHAMELDLHVEPGCEDELVDAPELFTVLTTAFRLLAGGQHSHGLRIETLVSRSQSELRIAVRGRAAARKTDACQPLALVGESLANEVRGWPSGVWSGRWEIADSLDMLVFYVAILRPTLRPS